MSDYPSAPTTSTLSDARGLAVTGIKAMARKKVGKVMHEWGAGKLRSGSKHGPLVTNQKQAVAIALSEARKAGKR